MAGNNWTREEVDLIVYDYFEMLSSELRGESYNKSEHRRNIIGNLNNRSDGSIERKHMNISAALIEMGMPYISGYKPYSNYQRLIIDAVNEYLDRNISIIELVAEDVRKASTLPELKSLKDILVDPPTTQDGGSSHIRDKMPTYQPRKVNFLEKEAQNTSLGLSGELLIMEYEKERLADSGKGYLADRIEHISETNGDGAGFDIHSYEENGTDRFIEVKTTKYGIDTPFYISANEVSFSASVDEKYFLYRLFNFRNAPKLFMKNGNIKMSCDLRPTQFAGRFT